MKIEFDTKPFSELKGGDAFSITHKRNPEDIFIKFDLPLRTEGNNIRVNGASLFDGHSMYFRDDLVVYPIQCMIIR